MRWVMIIIIISGYIVFGCEKVERIPPEPQWQAIVRPNIRIVNLGMTETHALNLMPPYQTFGDWGAIHEYEWYNDGNYPADDYLYILTIRLGIVDRIRIFERVERIAPPSVNSIVLGMPEWQMLRIMGPANFEDIWGNHPSYSGIYHSFEWWNSPHIPHPKIIIICEDGIVVGIAQ